MRLILKLSKYFPGFAITLLISAAAGLCAQVAQATTATQFDPLESAFTIQAANGQFFVRAITRAATCPRVVWDGTSHEAMAVRVGPATIPPRHDSAQAESKPSAFPVLTCELPWQAGAKRATVAGNSVPAPRGAIRRIVLVADTGCRMKASENAFQDCNDLVRWPWPQIAQVAAKLNPDLVVHIGDIHYRESPCPSGNAGCSQNAWGYGWEAWQADFFQPASPLLAAAPWLFVRGNHETCARAGQGWFRFIDTQAWSPKRSCDLPENDTEADFSTPFNVALTPDTQFVVFDSSKTGGKPYNPDDMAFEKYAYQLRTVAQLAAQHGDTFFLSHHPLLAAVIDKSTRRIRSGGNAGLHSVFESQFPDRLFPEGVSVAMHGHVHLFEAMSFQSKHPVSLVLGNSGSMNEGIAPPSMSDSDPIYKGTVIDDYASRSDFGFATLDRFDGESNTQWILTEYTTTGVPAIQCNIVKSSSRCKKIN